MYIYTHYIIYNIYIYIYIYLYIYVYLCISCGADQVYLSDKIHS